ncbi:MAG: hypothetical protein M0T69_06975, partial [Deltaproteobacteria bacterium]|nr:hypothetical protein [Deltaproteobacteria bacterium]
MRLRVCSPGENEQDEERIKDPQDAEEIGEVRTIFLKPSFPGGSLVAGSLREALSEMRSPMDTLLMEEIRDAARRIATERLKPRAVETDRERTSPGVEM